MDRATAQQFIQANYSSKFIDGKAIFTPRGQYLMMTRGRIELKVIEIKASTLEQGLEEFITEFIKVITNGR